MPTEARDFDWDVGEDCQHEHVGVEPCDQTVGVACYDCNCWIAVDWMESTIPPELWARATTGGARP